MIIREAKNIASNFKMPNLYKSLFKSTFCIGNVKGKKIIKYFS